MGGGASAAASASFEELQTAADSLSPQHRQKILSALKMVEAERDGTLITVAFESEDEEKVKICATVDSTQKSLDPFTMSISEANALENMCRIMYFQSGIGAQDQRLKLPDGRLVQVEGPDASKSLAELLGDLLPGVENEATPTMIININIEKDEDPEKVKILATVEGTAERPERQLDPFTVVIAEPNVLENMCRIMYFQCGIGAHQQRLKLSDGRLFQVGGADSEKSLADLAGDLIASL